MSQIIKISDLNDCRLDPYISLTENQLLSRQNPDNSIFIAESNKVIDLALKAGLTPLSFLMTNSHINNAGKEYIEKYPDTPVFTANEKLLSQMTGYHLTRGLLATFKRPALRNVEEVCKNANRIAVLEGITDSTNVGAIIRSAAALGIDAVLIAKGCADPLLRRSVRVSMGTVFQIPWTYIGNTTGDFSTFGIDTLKSLGFKTVAMALSDNSVNINDRTLKSEEKLAIILGTEGTGLKTETIKNCDYTVKIPMYHNVDSLNVAAASAVAFWELRK